MVSFDHRDPGTSEVRWMRDPRWARIPAPTRSSIDGADRVLVIAAHPDDETLGAGGLIARLHGRGARITVVLATAGEGSHGSGLVPTRSVEFATAIDRLAPGAVLHELALPDGALADRAADLAAAVTGAAAGAGLIVAPWRGDGHGDHRVAGEVAADAAARAGVPLLEYPIWLWHWAEPDDPAVPWSSFVRVDLDVDEQEGKALALAAYASQTSRTAGEPPILHQGMLAHFRRDREVFVVEPA